MLSRERETEQEVWEGVTRSKILQVSYIDVFSNSNNTFCPILFALLLSKNLYSFPILQDICSLYNNLGGNKEMISVLSTSTEVK